MTKLYKNNSSQEIDFAKLREDLVLENDFLTKLVNNIPAKLYFTRDIQEKISSEKHNFMNNKADAIKRGLNYSEMSAKEKHKRARLDPLCQKNVSQIHEELESVKKRKSRKKKDLNQPSASLTRAANIEELQKRLQERIKEFQAKRKVVGRANPVESKKLQARVKKMKSKASKIAKEKQLLNPHKETKPVKSEKKTDVKPVYNKEGKILYSKFDFSEEGCADSKKGEFSGKNYKKLLKKAEKKKEKIENLKSTNPELANDLIEKEKWKKALLKAENVKVKDDPTLLKKSLKKQEKMKKKKGKEWKERTEHVEHKKQARQEKRAKNIKKKKQLKLESKIKHAKKKGRVIPGF